MEYSLTLTSDGWMLRIMIGDYCLVNSRVESIAEAQDHVQTLLGLTDDSEMEATYRDMLDYLS